MPHGRWRVSETQDGRLIKVEETCTYGRVIAFSKRRGKPPWDDMHDGLDVDAPDH